MERLGVIGIAPTFSFMSLISEKIIMEGIMKKYPLYEVQNISNLKDLLDTTCEKHSKKIAFKYIEKKNVVEVTFEQLKKHILGFSAYLINLNLTKTHIALIGPNSYLWMVAYLSCIYSGNIVVPIDKELPNEDINNILLQSDAKVLIYANSYSDIANENSNLLCLNQNDITKYIDDGESLIKSNGISSFNIEINNDDLCTIVYTSGTTGTPKGVMLSHKNISSNVVGCCKNVCGRGQTMAVLPFNHVFSMTVGVLSTLNYGLCTCICSGLKKYKKELDYFSPNFMFLVPMIVTAMHNEVIKTAKELGKYNGLRFLMKTSDCLLKIGIDLRRKFFKTILQAFGGNLEWVSCGGAPVDMAVAKDFRSWGVEIIEGYGITECSPCITSNRNKNNLIGSAGTELYGCSVKIHSPDSDGIGEIYVKGDNVMLGYYKDEQATKDAFDDEWFKTGDLGYLDDDGFLFITGRKKNLIILSNGKNVSPEELEEKIQKIKNVNEVIVYAENDLITAEIYAENIDGIEAEVEKMNQDMPVYKQIQKVKFRDKEFEKTTTKKIKR